MVTIRQCLLMLAVLCGGMLAASAQLAPNVIPMHMGKSAMQQEEWVEAVRVWRTILTQGDLTETARADVQLDLARSLICLVQYDEAQVVLETLIQQQSNQISTQVGQALLLQTQIAALSGDAARLDRMLCRVLDDTVRRQDARERYLKSLPAISRPCVDAELASAIGRYRQARPGHPLYPHLCYTHAKLLLAAGQVSTAWRAADEGWRLAVGTSDETLCLGMLLDALAQQDRAIAVPAFEQLAAWYPEESVQGKALKYYLSIHAVPQAATLALQLVQHPKTASDALTALQWAGQRAIDQGDAPAARRWLTAFIQHAPETSFARAARAYLQTLPAATE